MKPVAAAILLALLTGCASTAPPRQPLNLCAVFAEKTSWQEPAADSGARWGIPVPVLMATIYHESSYKAEIRPPRPYYLGFIPGFRPSTAYGYAQAKDEVWKEYVDDQNRWFASRTNFADAIDFVGWYHHGSVQKLGLRPDDMRGLYLAYNEGRGGYARGTWQGKTKLVNYVEQRAVLTAARYQQQYAGCPLR